MNRFLSEIHEKYTKIVKSANLIGFLNRLAKTSNLTDKSTPWQYPYLVTYQMMYVTMSPPTLPTPTPPSPVKI